MVILLQTCTKSPKNKIPSFSHLFFNINSNKKYILNQKNRSKITEIKKGNERYNSSIRIGPPTKTETKITSKSQHIKLLHSLSLSEQICLLICRIKNVLGWMPSIVVVVGYFIIYNICIFVAQFSYTGHDYS